MLTGEQIKQRAKELGASERPGHCGAILSVEGGSAAAGSLDNIRSMYRDGVRLMTLTWNAENELGHGVWSPEGGGLSPFGKEAVALMNRLGMIVDVSHLSDAGFADVAKISENPFVASHSCSRALCPHRRNLTDEMFSVIRDRGGLVGINFCREFLDHCFELLGPYIKSCHIKDIALEPKLTVRMPETPCGTGKFDHKHYFKLIDRLSPEMPVIIEHLKEEEAFLSAVSYLQKLYSEI